MNYRTGRTSRVRLELVRQHGHPRGDPLRAYELVLPLNPDGHIDATSWGDNPSACSIYRIRPGCADAQGILARAPSGRWYFDYRTGGDSTNHQGIRPGDDRFRVGAMIGVNEEDGERRTFRVASVTPVATG